MDSLFRDDMPPQQEHTLEHSVAEEVFNVLGKVCFYPCDVDFGEHKLAFPLQIVFLFIWNTLNQETS